MTLPLAGIKILDFTKVLAGPLCTQYLADLGADVIKVESCDGGDDTRAWPPFSAGIGAIFLSVNRNKRSIAIDLKTDQGKKVALDLASKSDVVVESFSTGVADRLGISYEAVKAIRPDVIYCSISGYGRSGPLASMPGYDLMMQAFGGLLSIMGERGSDVPTRASFSPLDQTTGIHALSGILAALLQRNASGEGALIEVSLFETALAFLGFTAQIYWNKGDIPQRWGTAHESLCPYQAFKAADGYILITVGNDKIWSKFCAATGLTEVENDPRYRTNADRAAHFDETVAMVGQVIQGRTVGEWLDIFTRAGVPCAPVNTVDKVLQHPQTAARGMILDYSHPLMGKMHTIAHPVQFNGDKSPIRSAPPFLGEHSKEILKELDYSESHIDELMKARILRVWDPAITS